MVVEIQRGGHVQRLSYEDFEERVRDGLIDEHAQLRISAVTGAEFRRAGDLELFQELADPGRVAFRRALTRPGMPLATAVLVGIQLRLWWLTWSPERSGWMLDQLTNWEPGVVEAGELWRLISYGLLHQSLAHITANLLFVAYTGYHLERALGRMALVLLFFSSVITGGLLSALMGNPLPSLGSSGGAFGLLGATVVLGWSLGEHIPARARQYFGWALLPYIAISVVSGISNPQVDNWAHFGGLLGGVLLTSVLKPHMLPGASNRNRAVALLTAGVLGGILALIGAMGPRWMPVEAQEMDGWSVAHPRWWREGSQLTALSERGWYSPTWRASLVHTATQPGGHPSLDAATAQLLEILRQSRGSAEQLGAVDLVVQGQPARDLRLRFAGEAGPELLYLRVLVRGSWEHHVAIQVLESDAERYAPLVERLLASLSLSPPAELVAAEQAASQHPRSWEPLLRLGEERAELGDLAGARAALEQGLSHHPGHAGLLAARLELLALGQDPQCLTLTREALGLHPDDSALMAAAAQALVSCGAEEEGRSLLELAWARFPGDADLLMARSDLGMDLHLPDDAATP
jgi:rhomboid protease GluP